MSNFIIYRASAGSGKTFELVWKYLEKVFESPSAYKGILAVTFTNKAADEMKSRIFSELDRLDRDTGNSNYLNKLRERFNQPDSWIQNRAAQIKSRMLHDFSRISVGTIDSFFQVILRSFAREAGLAPAFQLETDMDRVLNEFAADIFKGIDKNPEAREWLTVWIRERMENGEKWHKLEADIIKTGKELLKEEILAGIVDSGSAGLTETDVSDLKRQCGKMIRDFRKVLDDHGNEARRIFEAYDLSPEDFWHKDGGPAGYLFKLTGKSDPPGRRFLDSVDNIECWLPGKKSGHIDPPVRQQVFEMFNRLTKEVISHHDQEYTDYRTALAISRNLFALWFTGSLIHFLQQYAKEKNLILLNLTQPLIQLIIKDNQSPFIYEKTGTYYHDFLIDEFQDTSDLQWKNFQPLVENSLSEDGMSMVVGDVKQSLYRWRNSNWKLLHFKAEQDLRVFGITDIPLDENQRSRSAIIDLNNFLFSQLPEKVLSGLDFSDHLLNVYDQAVQKPGRKSDLKGRAEIHFIDKKESELSYRERVAVELPAIIEDLLENKGYKQEDILFLVRKNTDGDWISQMLTDYLAKNPREKRESWSFVSADVFRISSAPVIRIIILAFRYLTDQENDYYLKLLEWELCRREPATGEKIIVRDFSVSTFYGPEILSLRNKDLLAICNELIRMFHLDLQVNDLPYLFQFHDQIRSFCLKSSGSVAGFLCWWDASGFKQNLVTENQSSAMRIMTIHKAKGLSSPVVIIPDCSWSMDHPPQHGPWLWVSTEKSPFNSVPLVPVRYSSGLTETRFSEQYFKEKAEAALDSLNLLYVALTRPTDVLMVYCPLGNRSRTVADVLHESLINKLENGICRMGDPDFMNPEPVNPNPGTVLIPCRLSDSKTIDKIAPLIETVGEEARFGRLIHDVLEKVRSQADFDTILDRMITAGQLSPDDMPGVRQRIDPIFSLPEIREWFDGSWEILTEPVILVPDSGENRPDRVMVRDNEAIVVDYKTGIPESRHQHQVATYIGLIRRMGYTSVKGYLLYLDKQVLVEVNAP
ncbi:MAG: UvrD-helicase domain-containing protein [Bacteroidota bacterium]